MFSKNKIDVLFAAIWLVFSASFTQAQQIDMHWQPVDSINATLPEGIRLFAGQNDALPLRAWYVRIAEKRSDLATRVVLSDDSSDLRETISSFASDLGAAVVVNGGYFDMRARPATHAGLLYIDGKLVAPATHNVTRDTVSYPTARAAIGFFGDGSADIAWVSNRNDSLFAWPSPPANRPDQPAACPEAGAVYWPVRDAIAAGPGLISERRIHITSDEEVFFVSSIPKTHPRTAIGYNTEDELLILVVDGRRPESRGVDLQELAVLMLELGAVEAMNLDGGGSSALVVNGNLINRPTGGVVEREVMSAIATFVLPKQK